jgi:hypothetical protein
MPMTFTYFAAFESLMVVLEPVRLSAKDSGIMMMLLKPAAARSGPR